MASNHRPSDSFALFSVFICFHGLSIFHLVISCCHPFSSLSGTFQLLFICFYPFFHLFFFFYLSCFSHLFPSLFVFFHFISSSFEYLFFIFLSCCYLILFLPNLVVTLSSSIFICFYFFRLFPHLLFLLFSSFFHLSTGL